MRLAIIADIHDNLTNLEICLAWCRRERITKLICLGDVTTAETLKRLALDFTGEVFLASGNGEIYSEADLAACPRINFYGKAGVIKIDGLKIGFVHEKGRLKKLRRTETFNFLFYGHSHRPGMEENGKTIIANPGNLAGIFYQATFAVLETENKKLELKIVAELTEKQ